MKTLIYNQYLKFGLLVSSRGKWNLCMLSLGSTWLLAHIPCYFTLRVRDVRGVCSRVSRRVHCLRLVRARRPVRAVQCVPRALHCGGKRVRLQHCLRGARLELPQLHAFREQLRREAGRGRQESGWRPVLRSCIKCIQRSFNSNGL